VSTTAKMSILGGLITILPVVQCRSRKDPNEAKFNDSSYSYRLRSYVNSALQDIVVYYKAFLSIHGISNRRYSLKDSEKIYLPEELNIKKLHTFYKDKHPENVVL